MRIPLPHVLLLVFLFFTTTNATFEPATLPESSFSLLFGLTICPDLITFTQPGLTHPSSTLFFDTRPITGGTLNLIPNPPAGGSGFTRHFSIHSDVVGTYYGGILSSRIQWDTSALGADTAFVFFTPDVTFRTTWEDVIGKRQPLEEVSGVPVYWFEEGVDYIVINNRCLLRRGSGSSSNGVTGTRGEGSDGCFPAHAKVTTPDGVKRIDSINTGDYVWTGRQFSEVFFWTHRDPMVWARHLTLVLSNNKTLTLTPGHLVYINNAASPAHAVRIGDSMSTDTSEATVINIFKNVFVRGLYNPHTTAGIIMVNGVKASTYTTAVETKTAHSLLVPLRAIFTVFGISSRAFEHGADRLAKLMPSGEMTG